LGYIDFDQLPHVVDPVEGFIATANNKVIPKEFPCEITADWDETSDGYRALRITTMLRDMIANGSTIDAAAMREVQLDYVSFAARDLMAMLPSHSDGLNKDGAAMVSMMRSWDYDMKVGVEEPTVYMYWYREMIKMARYGTGQTYWDNVEFIKTILRRNSDPACTAAGHTTCQAASAAAFNRVGARLTNSGAHRWGEDLHLAHFKHQVLGATPLKCLSDRYVGHGGDAFTINVGTTDWDTMTQPHGSSYRQIVDVSQLQSTGRHSHFLNPLGQSGNLLSPEYDNLLHAWGSGEYLDMTFGVPSESAHGVKSQQLQR
jgi:penicillin amidase